MESQIGDWVDDNDRPTIRVVKVVMPNLELLLIKWMDIVARYIHEDLFRVQGCGPVLVALTRLNTSMSLAILRSPLYFLAWAMLNKLLLTKIA